MARIVHIMGTPNSGGVQRLILWLTAAPALASHQHTIVCIESARGSMRPLFDQRRIPIHHCPLPWPPHFGSVGYRLVKALRHSLSWTFVPRLQKLLKTLQPDLVHTHLSTRVDLQAKAVVRGRQKPLVWTVHGLYRPEGPRLNEWLSALKVGGDHLQVTGVSQAVVNDFIQRTGCEADRVSTCHSAVDLAPYRSNLKRLGNYRKKLGIPEEALVFGSVGRLVNEKAYENFVAAAGKLMKTAPQCYFVIAGHGGERARLEQAIRSNGLEGKFHLVGDIADVPEFLLDLDVFVLPSRREGFGIVLVEALAAGLPCVATQVGGIPEILDSGGGILVDPECPEALLAGMSKMLAPQVREAAASCARVAAERFSIEKCAETYARIYDGMIQSGANASPAQPERVFAGA